MKSPRFASAYARWSLWQINLAIGVVIIIMIVLSVLWDRNLQRKLRKRHGEQTEQATDF
jgi:membrane protein implicated in regulation of membrane protease activity